MTKQKNKGNKKLIVPKVYVDGIAKNIPSKAITLKDIIDIGTQIGDNENILKDFIMIQAALIWGAQCFLIGKWNTSNYQKKPLSRKHNQTMSSQN